VFIGSIVMMYMHINKPLVVYELTAAENVHYSDGSSSVKPITRTYQDNYASVGAVIGFGILAAASLISFALVVQKRQTQ
jgi:hypothetical protein